MFPLSYLMFKYESAILFSVGPIVLYSLLPLSSSKMECFFMALLYETALPY